MAGLLHRTAQPPTLAAFRPWEGSAGAGRVRPAAAKIRKQEEYYFVTREWARNINRGLTSRLVCSGRQGQLIHRPLHRMDENKPTRYNCFQCL